MRAALGDRRGAPSLPAAGHAPEMRGVDKLGTQLYAVAIWLARDGRQADLVNAWLALGDWAARHQPGAVEALILQDIHRPQRLVSVDVWQDAESLDAWRATPEYRAFMLEARELCDRVEVLTTAEIGPALHSIQAGKSGGDPG